MAEFTRTVCANVTKTSSHLTKWRRERKDGILEGLAPQKRGPKSKANPLASENQKPRRDNERLTDRPRKGAQKNRRRQQAQKRGRAQAPNEAADPEPRALPRGRPPDKEGPQPQPRPETKRPTPRRPNSINIMPTPSMAQVDGSGADDNVVMLTDE